MQYAKREYWDEKYTRDSEVFEWYCNYGHLKPLIREVIPSKKAIILHLGCGTSTLGEDMEEDGYKEITNIDYSPVVIAARSKAAKSKLTYQTVDARNMREFPDGKFTHVIDKGLIDSLMCADVAPPEVYKVLTEVYRVLKPGGAFICVSHAFPNSRLQLFERPPLQWDLTVRTLSRQLPPEIWGPQSASANPLICIYIAQKGESRL